MKLKIKGEKSPKAEIKLNSFIPFSEFQPSKSMHACMLSRLSRVWLFATLWTIACQAPLSMGLSRQEYWLGCHFLTQGIFLTQGLNPRLLHLLYCRCILYPLSHWEATTNISPLEKRDMRKLHLLVCSQCVWNYSCQFIILRSS